MLHVLVSNKALPYKSEAWYTTRRQNACHIPFQDEITSYAQA